MHHLAFGGNEVPRASLSTSNSGTAKGPGQQDFTLQTRQNTMAIAAQLDAAVLAGIHSTALSLATSNELAEAFREDSTVGVTTNQVRLDAFWRSVLLGFQWQLLQARRGRHPSFDEVGIVEVLRTSFSTSHSFEGWWEDRKLAFSPEFVEWVEEQRAKAA